MKKNIRPTDAELEILQLLWSAGPSTVRFVHDELSQIKTVFYTTTLKTMQVMHEKGLLSRDTSTRSHIYKPQISKSSVQKSIVTKIKETVFGGSMSQLMISAIGQGKPSKKELDEIKALINKLEEDV